MTTRTVSLVVSLCLLAAVCSAQTIKFKPRQIIVPSARFRKPVQPISNPYFGYKHGGRPFKRNRAFLQKNRMLDVVMNYRNKEVIHLLSWRLQPYWDNVKYPKVKVSFSGHFFPSKKAMNRAAHEYIKPEFQVSPQQAVSDMLVQATRLEHGYGVIKVYETFPDAQEPRMSMLVLDVGNMEWLEYTGNKAVPTEAKAPTVQETQPALEAKQPAQTTGPRVVHKSESTIPETTVPQNVEQPSTEVTKSVLSKVPHVVHRPDPTVPETTGPRKPKYYTVSIRNGRKYRTAVY